MNLTRIAAITGIIISLSAVTGLLFKLDGRWAKASLVETVSTLSMRLDIKILEDRVNAIQERIWKLEDRYKNVSRMPQSVKDEYRHLHQKIKELGRKIIVLLRQQGG